MRLATWNVNSVRLRLDILGKLAAEHQPDVVCLQEIKARPEDFPFDAVRALFPHIHLRSMKGYNGVAILSRLPLTDPQGRVVARIAKVSTSRTLLSLIRDHSDAGEIVIDHRQFLLLDGVDGRGDLGVRSGKVALLKGAGERGGLTRRPADDRLVQPADQVAAADLVGQALG